MRWLLVVPDGEYQGSIKVANNHHVLLHAYGAPGYELESWYTGAGDPIPRDKEIRYIIVNNVTADDVYRVRFRQRPRLIVTTEVVNEEGEPDDRYKSHCGGYVSRDPNGYDYDLHEEVELTAHPYSQLPCNWRFHHWVVDGVDVGGANPLAITMDNNRKVIACFGPAAAGPCKDLTITVPALDPPTANNYCFDSSPTGVCNVHAQGTTDDGTQNNLLEWYLSSMSGSTLTCTNDRKGPSVTFTYTGLPGHNSAFGNKTLALGHPNGCETVTQTVQIFFQEEATNHPGAGQGDVPNWYYYWEQTPARGSGEHRLDSPQIVHGSCTFWDAERHCYTSYIGRDAANDDFELQEWWWKGNELSGIHTYAYACRHEAQHVEDFTLWWQGDDSLRNSITDSDGDWIPDELEDDLQDPGPFDPTMTDTNLDGVDDADEWATWHMDNDWDFWEEDPPAAVPKTIEYDWGANGTQSNR